MGSGASSTKTTKRPPINKPPPTNDRTHRRVPDDRTHRRGPQGFQERNIGLAEDHRTEFYTPAPPMERGNPWQRVQDGHGNHGQGGPSQPRMADVVMAAIQAGTCPQYPPDKDFGFELFIHSTGRELDVIYEDGKRFVLDPASGAQQPFPLKWYSEGLLVEHTPVQFTEETQVSSQPSRTAPSKSEPMAGPNNRKGKRSRNPPVSVWNPGRTQEDDRASYIEHPTLGKIKTYMAQETRNVHRFFNEPTGSWVILPLAWELHSSLVQELLPNIEEMCPEIQDVYEIIGCLRAANYDLNDCVNDLFQVKDLGFGAKASRNIKDVKKDKTKDAEISQLKKKTKDLQTQLEKCQNQIEEHREGNKNLKQEITDLQDRLSEAEVRAKNAFASLAAVQRPKSGAPVKVTHQVEPQTVQFIHRDVTSLHKTQVRLKMGVQQGFQEIKVLIDQSLNGLRQIKSVGMGSSNELVELRELYRKETLQRKILYNKIQELRGNIRVFARCRHDERVECAYQFPSNQECLAPTPAGSTKKFKFDRVFGPASTQADIFEDTRPIITSCVDGYNVCILAYGQTGSGKTYTMMGPMGDPGVNIRSIKELLLVCGERETVNYTLMISMIEIYNEAVHDLLSPDVKVLMVQQQGTRVHLTGLTDMKVDAVDDIVKIIDIGNGNRATASTKMNSESSRSHLVVTINVEGVDAVSGARTRGSLMLCDLAGSERIEKTEAVGQRLVEAANINKSLTALGQVFTALRTGQMHVPYRNSKLTHILQPALGGDAKACLFVTASPDIRNLSETLSSLQFGSNARQVALGQAKQNITK